MWDALGDVLQRAYNPENTQQLKQMLIEEWAPLPQEMPAPAGSGVYGDGAEATIAAVRGRGHMYHINEHLLVVLPVDRPS
ncbi:hypothetical protein TNCV_5063551 [Trichonephila clavipes]|nr:hypothetical protein TNCV_5063551 [Trichonephila clavipes]